MNRYFVEVSLTSLGVKENFRPDQEDINTLTVTLFYPRPGMAGFTTVKSFKLHDNSPIDFVNDFKPGSHEHYSLPERWLLREEVWGDGLHLAAFLTAIDKPSKLDEFLSLLAGTIFKGLWGAASGGMGNLIFSGAVAAVGTAHVGSFKRDKDPIYCIGAAELAVPKLAAGESLHTLGLVVPDTISREGLGKKEPGQPAQKIELVRLEKGVRNGTLGLSLAVTPL